MQNFRVLGAPPQTPVPPAAGRFFPTPPLAAGGREFRPHTPKTAPHCEFLATRLATQPTHTVELRGKCFAISPPR